MKTSLTSFLALVLSFIAIAADPLKDALQRGLLAEEAQHDLKAAAEAYAEAVRLGDEQRVIVATAVFRLAETQRRLGQTNEATAGYRRLIFEFPEQEKLVALARIRSREQSAAHLSAGDVAMLIAQTGQMETTMLATEARLAKNDSLLQSLKAKSGTHLWHLLNSAHPTPLLQALVQDLEITEMRLQSLNPDIGPEHPDRKRISRVLEQIEAQLSEEAAGIVAALTLEVDSDRDTVKRLTQLIASNRRQLDTVEQSTQAQSWPSGNMDQLMTAWADVADRLAREEALFANSRTKTPPELVQALSSSRPTPLLNKLMMDRSTAQQRLAALGEDLGPEHPDMKQARHTIAALDEKIDAEAKNILNGLETSVAGLKASLSAIERKQEEMKRQPAPAPDEQSRLLLQEIGVAEAQLANAQKKAEAGSGPQEDVLKAQREVLSLRRQLAALPRLVSRDMSSSTANAEKTAATGSSAADAYAEVDRLSAELAALEQLGTVAERARALMARYPKYDFSGNLRALEYQPQTPDEEKQAPQIRRSFERQVQAVMDSLKERLRFATLEADNLSLRQATRTGLGKVILYGDGGMSGTFPLPPGEVLMLTDVILRAGGGSGSTFANLKKVRLHRLKSDKGEEVTTIDVKKILEQGDRSADIELQDGDRIEVLAKTIVF